MKILLNLFWILKANKFFIGLFFTTGILWANPYVTGQGSFHSKKGDPLVFIKTQLLYSAFRDVISNELKAMKLDQKKFWSNYEQQFSQYFNPIADSLKKRFLDKKGRISKRKEYKIALRKKKLTSKGRYGNLNKIVPSYSIRNTTSSASSKERRSHKIEIHATVNRRTLHQIYLSFTKSKIEKTFEKLFISTHFDINNIQWSALDMSSQNDLTDTITNHWKNWFKTHMGNTFQEIVIVNDRQREFIANNLPSDSQSFWLKIHTRIEKTHSDNFLNINSFLISANYLFVNPKTKTPILYGEKKEALKHIEFENIKDLNSQLATLIYQEPISLFDKMKSSIKSLSLNQNYMEIIVKNAPTILAVLQLSDFISHEGIIHGVQTLVSHYDASKSLITLSYTNKKEEIITFLKTLNNRTFIKNKTLKIDENMNFNILTKLK